MLPPRSHDGGRNDVVSVGSSTNSRQIVNVAAGTAPTDAVNVQQLKVSYTTAQVQLKSAQATRDIQQAAFDRQQALVTQAVASSSTLDAPKQADEEEDWSSFARKRRSAMPSGLR